MRKGIHPALQLMRVVSPDGRLWEILTPRIYKNDKKCRSLAQEEEAMEREGQVARFRRRYAMAFDDSDDEDARPRRKMTRPWRSAEEANVSEEDD